MRIRKVCSRVFACADKKGVRGTGLGLAIVKRLVELHKGTVWLENNADAGTVFYMRLPKYKK